MAIKKAHFNIKLCLIEVYFESHLKYIIDKQSLIN